MNYVYQKMTKEYALRICDWKYRGPYSFYDMTEDEDDLNEFLSPENWNRIYAALAHKDLAGFFQYERKDGFFHIGLGLRPDLTGRGLGKEFVSSAIDFLIGEAQCKRSQIRLSVAAFNKRAIKTYSAVGFRVIDEYIENTNGGHYPFLAMQLTTERSVFF